MSVFAVFIDGPLAQETKQLHEAMPTFRVPLPSRETYCSCEDELFSYEPKVFEYFCIASGPGLALYSKERSPNAVRNSLLNWVITDLSNVDKLHYHCRDRRAWE